MPMYDYVCQNCLSKYEIYVKDGQINIKCPKCGEDLKKLPAAPSFFIH